MVKNRAPVLVSENGTTVEKQKGGGGVALLFRDGLNPKPIILEKRWENKHEVIGAEIGEGSNSFSIFTWYIPPCENTVDEEVLGFMENRGEFILVGDLNAKMSTFDQQTNSKGRSLEKILEKTRGKTFNKVGMPTNFTHRNGRPDTASTIDISLASNKVADGCVNFETLPISAVSKEKQMYYHVPIIIDLELEIKPKKTRLSHHKSYLYDKANWQDYRKKIDQEMVNLGQEMTINELSDK